MYRLFLLVGTITGLRRFASAQTTTSTAVCTSTPIPNSPACSGTQGLLGTFNDGCGAWNYTIYCGYDSNPSSGYTATATTALQCMQACDNYPYCVAATWDAVSACYLKLSTFSGYTGVSVYASSNTALYTFVRYKFPNPAYQVPIPAPGVNTSTGCGNVLPAGLTINGPSQSFWMINPSDGYNRTWSIHIPRYYNPNAASPLIFAFPGAGEYPSQMEQETMLSYSDYNPYGIMAYVQGVGLGFTSNPAYGVAGQTYAKVDDLGFMNVLLQNLSSTYCIDTGRIFATGFSNGGGFANVLASDPVWSTKIAAFAIGSGAVYTNYSTAGFTGNVYTVEPVNTVTQPVCSPGRMNTPMLEFHGNADPTINYTGDYNHNGRIIPAIVHWTTDWSVRQGYGSSNYTFNPTFNKNVVGYQFGGAAGQLGIVTHYMSPGGVHKFPAICNGGLFDAGPVVMDFFYRWTDNSRPPTFFPTTTSACPSFVTIMTTVTMTTSACPSTVTVITTVTATSRPSS